MGFRALVASLRRELNGLTITVGVHGDAGVDDDNGVSLAVIASVHEFGSQTVHARPFIRPTFDSQKERYWRRIRGALVAAARRHGTRSLQQNLGQVGEGMVSDIRRRIRSRIAPTLSDATIARREKKITDRGGRRRPANNRFSGWTPLIDDGQLIGSLRWVVRRGGVEIDRGGEES